MIVATIDPSVVPGLLLLALELLALALVGFVVSRVLLRQSDDFLALSQGLAVGLALWGLIANFAMHLTPGLTGAIVAWIVIVGIGAGLAWRRPSALRVSVPTTAIFVATVLSVFWVALAGRQLLSIADDEIHHGLAASIRAGGFPPVLPWHPGQPAPYHYGIDMLVGLLTPPTGPDLAFVNELLGAYIWTSLALVAVACIYKHGGWIATIVLSPVLLTAGAWTLFGSPNPPSILQIPVPTGTPGTGLRSSLTEVYFPSFELPLKTNFDASPPNIWRPSFPLAYTLSFIVLERAAIRRSQSWKSTLTLGGILGFLGLIDEPVALISLGLWIIYEFARFLGVYSGHGLKPAPESEPQAPITHHRLWHQIIVAAGGPLLTIAILAAGGGFVTSFLTGTSHATFTLQLIDDPGSRRPLGTLTHLAGGVGILGIGPLVIATLAISLHWRSSLVRMLATASSLFLLAALILRYEPFPADISRMDGNARNFALLALLPATAFRLSKLQMRNRHIAALGLIAFVTWPTVATPARALGHALDRGPQFSNMPAGPREFHEWFLGRHAVKPFHSEVVATFIRDHTPPDTRVLSPHPAAMTVATGRPNGSGFETLLHIIVGTGPEYKDAITYLEPAAIRKIGFSYIHSTDEWIETLPDYAVRWLHNPDLFTRVLLDGPDSLYRIRPEFFRIESPVSNHSFESLGKYILPSTSIYLSPDLDDRDSLRAVAAIPQADHFGEVDTSVLHMISELEIRRIGRNDPDIVVTSSHLAPVSFSPVNRRPVWQNEALAAYAPRGGFQPIVDPPPQHFSVQLSDVHMVNGLIGFTATFVDRSSSRWTGQDWVVIPADGSEFQLPDQSRRERARGLAARWFIGLLQPVPESAVHEYFYLYRFDPRTAMLTIWDGERFAAIEGVENAFGEGDWLLAVRLLNRHREVALIPVIQFTLTASGDFTYKFYEESLDVVIDN
jgi:hypothetical protein